MRRTVRGSIVAMTFRGVVFGAMAMLALGVPSIASAGALLEICTPGGGCPALATSATFPLTPPGPPDPTGRGMTISITETTPVDPNQIPIGTRGYVDRYLFLAGSGTGQPHAVTFTMLGHGDSSFNNEFQVRIGASTPIDWFTHGATPTPPGTTITLQLPINELLDFRFITPIATAINDGSHNPAGPGDLSDVDYFLSLDQTLQQPNQGLSGYIGLSDGGFFASSLCQGKDCDFQDMVIRVSTVPEPATLLLLGFGLVGLGAAGWRCKPR